MATRRARRPLGAGVPAAEMRPPPSEQALDALLAHKEEEWRALQAHRSQMQEAALQDAQSRLEEAQGRLQRLQEDFVYNLQVLDERDRELERYDAAFAQARGLEEARQAEASQLKIEVAKLRRALASEAQRLRDLQQQYQRKLQEHHLELERTHSDKNGEMDQQRELYENLKWKLERKLQELDGELALQRQELLQEFASEMRKREHEFRLQADSMSSAVLAQELKVKLLNKELAALREAGAKAAESLLGAEAANSGLEEQLRRRDWALRDLAAVKDARIKELEGELHSVQLTRRREEEALRRKHEELDRLAREKDTVLAAAKGAHVEQLQVLEAKVLELQSHSDNLEVQLRRAEWRQEDVAKEKDAAIDKLREDAAALRSGWDAQIAQLSEEMTSKDLQVQSLREEEMKLKAQVARCQQDIGRYKQQLLLAAERERSLERDKVQLELDWQRRCEGLEREQYQRSEDLIQALTAARDQEAAKLQETELVLREQEAALKAVTRERDQAVQALRARRFHPKEEAQMFPRHCEEDTSASLPSSEIQRLQEQNRSLRNAIAQMRKEMEALSDQVLPSARLGGETTGANPPGPQAAADAPIPGYILALEAEMQNLKHKFETLEAQLEDVIDPSRTSVPCAGLQPSVPAPTDPTGGAALGHGASTGLALRRLRDRAHLLNFLVARLKQKGAGRARKSDALSWLKHVCAAVTEVLRGPLDRDTIQRELPHELDQVHLEVLQLRKQVAKLEKHLGSAWKEGGGASSRQQPPSSDTMALGGEGGDAGPAGTEDQGAQTPKAVSLPQLQRKLKEAARKILHLRQEKEQLLEMGNRLRAELGHLARKPPRHPLPTPEAQGPGEAPDPPLGQLQPHLTTQRQHPVPTVTCRSTPQKENQSPKPRLAQEFQEERGPHTQGSSSVVSSSLQDTWKLLDLGSSPSGLTSPDDSAPERPASPAAYGLQHPEGSPTRPWVAFAVEGTKMEAQARGKPTGHPGARPAKPQGCQQPPKIRNYNSKE
ncbi:coiled-coil domain-containing protein 57 isoform X4 [Camelus ferus]|uniref:Coiled-coil domain-containing protein 57 isoform X4 n=1 Tax=Camelus ferus TaxID=419612 RepID=A0A8B8UKP5_CAMFR|nr:coiled-coil domain-containing protein 57 isoform X4 [Camelus ferus]